MYLGDPVCVYWIMTARYCTTPVNRLKYKKNLAVLVSMCERKLCRAHKAHLHSAVRALSSPSLQLPTNLDKDFFRYI